jgi:hypothetical protein
VVGGLQAAGAIPTLYRAPMGLPPTHRNQSQNFVTPAQAGVHLDSRLRGNDATFERATRLPASSAVSAFLTALTLSLAYQPPPGKGGSACQPGDCPCARSKKFFD